MDGGITTVVAEAGPHPTAELAHLPMWDGTARLAAARALRNPQPVPAGGGVLTVVRELAAADPARVAVESSGTTTTYAELCTRANQIRAALLAWQCGPGDRVAVVGPRSMETIATFLAIESLGASYLPLDPAWPTPRLVEVLHRTGPRCLLRHGAEDARPAEQAAAEVGLPVVMAPGRDAPVCAAARRVVPDDEPRYIVHTSGSTGRPKGATVTQLGLTNHLRSMVAVLGLAPSDTVAFSAPPHYVISIWQMLAALLVGGRVAVVDESDMRFGRRLARRAAQAEITVMELVPTVIGWLVTSAERAGVLTLPRLRCLISTGEKLDNGLAASFLDTFPTVALYNAYGSTECSDDVSMHLVTPVDLNEPRLPIGSPVPNAVLYLLVQDSGRWRAAEPGEIGELWVGGAPVGAGYADDPELTRAAFFRDDFDPGSRTGRLYRTGDLAVLADGRAYCLGRVDRQVKIAGVRIELDDVEETMSRIPGVARCAALTEAVNGQDQLAVYYVAHPDVSQEQLYGAVRAALPSAMFPRRWVRLDTFPLNGSGKVDYRALSTGRAP